MNLRPRRREDMTPEINLVSLIDVVLLLVVFFMLSSKFTTEGRLRIRLPQASALPAQRAADEGLVVTVSATGSYLVNARELVNSSPDTLRSAILKTVGGSSRTTVSMSLSVFTFSGSMMAFTFSRLKAVLCISGDSE